jgi:hypothetical protein
MLDKKSSIYSDRPVLQMGGELVGWKNTFVLLPYGDRFRRYRRLFHRLIGSQSTMKQFLLTEELETRRFLRRVLINPVDLSTHIRQYVPTNSLWPIYFDLRYHVKHRWSYNSSDFTRIRSQGNQ